jgi:hypothetical protein
MGSSISPYEGTKIIFITTAGDFTAPAIEQIKTSKVPIELWDRKRLIAEIQTINYDLDEGWAILNELEAKEMGYSDTQSLDITSFDIDRISGNPASKRNKINVMKEILEELETRLGKLIPIEEIEKSVGDKLKPDEIEETLEKLVRAGDLFRPRKGYVQRM